MTFFPHNVILRHFMDAQPDPHASLGIVSVDYRKSLEAIFYNQQKLNNYDVLHLG
jgi:hypothetical protein